MLPYGHYMFYIKIYVALVNVQSKLIYHLMSIPKFDINTFFREDANAIFTAREKGIAIHKSKNIDAAGDEIELPVKEIIKNRLPQLYYVGQGHIVDSDLNTSGQFDIIIADNKGSPILFSSENKTDYLTYESVYAVGEVKSTFYKSKKYISDFVKKVNIVNNVLKREATPLGQISQDFRFSTTGSISITSDDRRGYKNPLFKFMFFVNSGDVDYSALCNELNSYSYKDIPNVIVFLDKGIILKAEANQTKASAGVQWNIGKVDLWPEFIDPAKESVYRSLFYEFDESTTSASCLAYIVYALNMQLSECLVLKPDLVKYHNNLFKVKKVSL